MKSLCTILAVLIVGVSWANTNEVFPAVTLKPLELNPLELNPQKIDAIAERFKQQLEVERLLIRIYKFNPDGHSMVYFKMKQIKETAKTNPSKAKADAAALIEKLRSWGADI